MQKKCQMYLNLLKKKIQHNLGDIMIAIIEIKEDIFSKTWKNYLKKRNIPFFIIKKLSSKIFEDLSKATCVLWHWNLTDYENYPIAKEFLTSLDRYSKLKIFPDFNTIWHYDDKLGQSMIFDLVKAPQPNYWFFLNKSRAIEWSKNTKYPVVFKLRKGAGSSNVQLINNNNKARNLINKMFNNGIKPKSSGVINTIVKKDYKKILRYGIGKALKIYLKTTKLPREKGYIYFQEFIPNCDRDYRVNVINNKAYAFIRYTRENDFRASGSGKYLIDHANMDTDCIKIAFEISAKLNLKSGVFDFLKSERGFLLTEISYDFVPSGGTFNGKWDGFWDKDLNFITQEVDPVILILEALLEEADIISKKNKF